MGAMARAEQQVQGLEVGLCWTGAGKGDVAAGELRDGWGGQITSLEGRSLL